MIPVETSPIAKLTTTTATSMMFIGLRNWPSATAQTDGGFSLVISFGPNCSSRFATSAALKPAVASTPSDAATSRHRAQTAPVEWATRPTSQRSRQHRRSTRALRSPVIVGRCSV